jgi:hypothetical protein
MKVNLNQLAAELARADNPHARNEDIVAVKTVLAALGKKLRSAGIVEALSILCAIGIRAGKQSGE